MTERRAPRWSELRPLLRPRAVPLDPTRRRLERAATIRDLRAVARRRTPRAVFDYTDGGADAELSLRRSREACTRVEFLPRTLRDDSDVDTSPSILGRPSALPLAFAPTGFTRMMHHEGERAVGRVAERAGIPYALSTMGTTSVEQLAIAAPYGNHAARPGRREASPGDWGTRGSGQAAVRIRHRVACRVEGAARRGLERRFERTR